jgi:hypothetical protein
VSGSTGDGDVALRRWTTVAGDNCHDAASITGLPPDRVYAVGACDPVYTCYFTLSRERRGRGYPAKGTPLGGCILRSIVSLFWVPYPPAGVMVGGARSYPISVRRFENSARQRQPPRTHPCPARGNIPHGTGE